MRGTFANSLGARLVALALGALATVGTASGAYTPRDCTVKWRALRAYNRSEIPTQPINVQIRPEDNPRFPGHPAGAPSNPALVADPAFRIRPSLRLPFGIQLPTLSPIMQRRLNRIAGAFGLGGIFSLSSSAMPLPKIPHAAQPPPATVPEVPLWPRLKFVKVGRDLIQSEIDHKFSDYPYGEYILQYEMRKMPKPNPKQLAQWMAKYERMLARTKKIFSNGAPFNDQMNAFRKELFDRYMSNYCRDNAQVHDFLDKYCANCVAQTHLLISLLRDAKVEIPQEYDLGMQIYADHLRPVFFERATGKVIDLVYGDTSPNADAPIYAPGIIGQIVLKQFSRFDGKFLNHNFLITEGVPKEGGEDARSEAEKRRDAASWNFNTNSVMEYGNLGSKAGKNSFFGPQKAPPKYAQLQYQPMGAEKNELAAAGIEGNKKDKSSHGIDNDDSEFGDDEGDDTGDDPNNAYRSGGDANDGVDSAGNGAGAGDGEANGAGRDKLGGGGSERVVEGGRKIPGWKQNRHGPRTPLERKLLRLAYNFNTYPTMVDGLQTGEVDPGDIDDLLQQLALYDDNPTLKKFSTIVAAAKKYSNILIPPNWHYDPKPPKKMYDSADMAVRPEMQLDAGASAENPLAPPLHLNALEHVEGSERDQIPRAVPPKFSITVRDGKLLADLEHAGQDGDKILIQALVDHVKKLYASPDYQIIRRGFSSMQAMAELSDAEIKKAKAWFQALADTETELNTLGSENLFFPGYRSSNDGLIHSSYRDHSHDPKVDIPQVSELFQAQLDLTKKWAADPRADLREFDVLAASKKLKLAEFLGAAGKIAISPLIRDESASPRPEITEEMAALLDNPTLWLSSQAMDRSIARFRTPTILPGEIPIYIDLSGSEWASQFPHPGSATTPSPTKVPQNLPAQESPEKLVERTNPEAVLISPNTYALLGAGVAWRTSQADLDSIAPAFLTRWNSGMLRAFQEQYGNNKEIIHGMTLLLNPLYLAATARHPSLRAAEASYSLVRYRPPLAPQNSDPVEMLVPTESARFFQNHAVDGKKLEFLEDFKTTDLFRPLSGSAPNSNRFQSVVRKDGTNAEIIYDESLRGYRLATPAAAAEMAAQNNYERLQSAYALAMNDFEAIAGPLLKIDEDTRSKYYLVHEEEKFAALELEFIQNAWNLKFRKPLPPQIIAALAIFSKAAFAHLQNVDYDMQKYYNEQNEIDIMANNVGAQFQAVMRQEIGNYANTHKTALETMSPAQIRDAVLSRRGAN